VLLLQARRDLRRQFNRLQLERELLLGGLGVDLAKGPESTFEVTGEDGETGSLGEEVHADELTDGEGEGEGEEDAPAVVDVLETGGDGVCEHLATGDEAGGGGDEREGKKGKERRTYTD
jgi:hypothetical protein